MNIDTEFKQYPILLDTTAAIQEILSQPQSFDNPVSKIRQTKYPEFKHTKSVYLREAINRPLLPGEQGGDILECQDTAYIKLFPECWKLVLQAFPNTKFGRVVISYMTYPGIVPFHVDGGRMASEHHRNHICITAEDSEFFVNDVGVKMTPGQVWEINNYLPHSVINHKGNRFHLIVDTID